MRYNPLLLVLKLKSQIGLDYYKSWRAWLALASSSFERGWTISSFWALK
jgi:hypothetical protein